LAGMMNRWKNKTSKFGVSVKDRQALFGVLRFKEVFLPAVEMTGF
jgi:hypothetical protein